MEKVKVKIKLLDKDAKIPFYGSEEAAGFDLYSVEEVLLKPGETKAVKTGVSLEIEKGYCFQLWGRSGLGVKGIHRFAGLGDSDYRGEYKVVLHNSTDKEYTIGKGDRIVQVVPVPIVKADFEVVEELTESKRGQGGFHSTGK
jgi:dUTP pyrophosphatase